MGNAADAIAGDEAAGHHHLLPSGRVPASRWLISERGRIVDAPLRHG